METKTEKTLFYTLGTSIEEIDINYLEFDASENPLVIATRESQIVRIRKAANAGKTYNILGYWDLEKQGYITSGKVNKLKVLAHDRVFFLDPDRASMQKEYKQIINMFDEI
jgi:hypothetical protein